MWRQELRWMRHVVRAQDGELRLDRWLRRQFPSLPQSFLQSQLRRRKIRLQPPFSANADVQVDHPTFQSTHAQSLLLEGSVVFVDAHLFRSKLQPMIEESETRHKRTELTVAERKMMQRLMQRVVYRDAHFVVLNKPHGLTVQDGSALTESLDKYLPSIAEALVDDTGERHAQDQQELKLVHRLDKETSGVLVLARSRLAAAKFSEQLRDGAVQKTYEALVSATSSKSDSYSVLRRFEGHEVKLLVGGPRRRVRWWGGCYVNASARTQWPRGHNSILAPDASTSSACTALRLWGHRLSGIQVWRASSRAALPPCEAYSFPRPVHAWPVHRGSLRDGGPSAIRAKHGYRFAANGTKL